jgi:hypothetical protein
MVGMFSRRVPERIVIIVAGLIGVLFLR